MAERSRKKETREHAAEEHKKSEEDLDRASRDLHKKMAEKEQKHGAHTEHARTEHGRERVSEKATAAGRKEARPDVGGAKWIDSLDEHEDHHGQSLATRNHDVIVQWAEKRKAQPATIEGTEHEGRLGVLRFDFPGYGSGVKAIEWDEWFKTFDARGLTFLYQEHLKNGNESNFFKVTSPHREDG
jgi:hypothetical protein